MAQLTKESVSQAGEKLVWLAQKHELLVSGLRGLRGSPTQQEIAKRVAKPYEFVNRLFNKRAYLFSDEAKPALQAIGWSGPMVQEWLAACEAVSMPKWRLLILYPDAIRPFIDAQLKIIGADPQPHHTNEVLAYCLLPDAPDQALQLLRLSNEGFQWISQPENAAELQRSTQNQSVVIRLRHYDRCLLQFRARIFAAVQGLRSRDDDESRALSKQQIAELAGYSANTVNTAMSANVQAVETFHRIYLKLCKALKKQPELPTFPTVQEIFSQPIQEDEEIVRVSEAKQAERPPPSTDSAPPNGEPSVLTTESDVFRLEFKMAFWRFLRRQLPPAWTTATSLIALLEGHETIDSIMSALQGEPSQEALLDQLIKRLTLKAEANDVPLFAGCTSVAQAMRPTLGESIGLPLHLITMVASVTERIRRLQGQEDIRSDQQLVLAVMDLYHEIELFTSACPGEFGDIIRKQRAFTQTLRAKG